MKCMRRFDPGNALVVQWLGPGAFTGEGPGSIPGQGTEILEAAQCGQERKKVSS